MAKLSITGQCTELDYTIDRMRKYHESRINARQMKQSEVDLHNERLLAVLGTLNWFADHEQFIRDCFNHRERIVSEILMDP
jgi:hypothetical protein